MMDKTITIDDALNLIEKEYLKLNTESRNGLKECATIRIFEKNTTLVKENQYSKSLMFILKGSIRAYYLKDGKDISDWFAFEGDFICELNSFFHDKPSVHYFETLEESTIMLIPKDSMMQLCDKYHDIERLSRYSITRTMIRLQQRLVSLQFETALQRYNSLLAVYPNITQRVSLSNIASFLGITLETLSRIRKPKKRI